MLLINTDDTLGDISSLNYENTTVMAASMGHFTRPFLYELSQETAPVHITLSTASSVLEQCLDRTQYYITVNAPLVASMLLDDCERGGKSESQHLDTLMKKGFPNIREAPQRNYHQNYHQN